MWLRLGQGIAGCVEHAAVILRALELAEPDYVANVLWTQILGTTHLARIGVGIREAAPGVPALFAVEREQLVATCVGSTRAVVAAAGR